jgi:5-methylcytosine-specific restriction enzyme subunit McrC
MNMLFESYVARLLQRGLSRHGFMVQTQGGYEWCLHDMDRGLFRTRPDIIVRRHGESAPALIIDTKWKRMTPRLDDPKQGISQSDVYQLMAYSQLYECAETMLLYPHHHGLGQQAGPTRYSIARRESGSNLRVATVDVAAPRSNVTEALVGLVAPLLMTRCEWESKLTA